ncbi:hypothetical protein CW304_31340 [Bacillus sp. UFRGS-B20]|nr:hypothetical protein CW304_31340 [Bacillus sp. UFRGS-B20]
MFFKNLPCSMFIFWLSNKEFHFMYYKATYSFPNSRTFGLLYQQRLLPQRLLFPIVAPSFI